MKITHFTQNPQQSLTFITDAGRTGETSEKHSVESPGPDIMVVIPEYLSGINSDFRCKGTLPVQTRTRVAVLMAAILVVVPSGCRNDGKLKVYPVSGQVLYNGAPLKGIDIAFHPVDPKNDTGYPPHATTDAEGRFSLATYLPGDGAPAGEWKVALAFAVESIEEGSDQTRRLSFQIPQVYHTRESTPISVTIRPEPNTLEPFRLEGPPLPASRKK
jgi:hypothetical protein